MGFLADQLLGHRLASAAPDVFLRFLRAPPSQRLVDDPQQTLERRLRAAQDLVRPGFMTLRPVRIGARIVDFVWVFASAMARHMLGHTAVDLYGRRLLVVLADQDGCESVFIQYRSVVELGAAAATQQMHRVPGSHDTLRHGAVRLGDGVAVTLISVSAARRADALGLALHAQRAMAAAYAD
jgi:uncharacterized membrane protein YgcG